MATFFDINVLPLVRQAGQDQIDLTGLHVAEPPRRPARSRVADRLILHFYLAGNLPLSPGKQDQILASLAKTYYETTGSVTAALRAVAVALNEFLLERNLRGSNTGRQSVGLLTLIVLRGEQLYLSQSGPVHAFIITADQVQQLYDPQITGRGLGLSRATPIRYFQTGLLSNDTLLVATQPPATWSAAALSGIHGQGPESMRRRLLNRDLLNVNAVLIQVKQGTGKVHLLQARPAPQVAPFEAEVGAEMPAGTVVPPVPQPDSERTVSREVLKNEPLQEGEIVLGFERIPDLAPESLQAQEAAESSIANKDVVPQPAFSALPVREMGLHETGSYPAAAPPARSKPSLAPLWKAFALLVRPFVVTFRWVARGVRALLVRMLPGESFFTIPSATMAFFAVAVPLVVVTIASMVYFNRGRDAQYNFFYHQAEQSAGLAAALPGITERRSKWNETLIYLEQAERFRSTQQSQNLRLHAQRSLDELELIRRPDYKPAIIGGLPLDVRVNRMVVAENELYLLDGNSGKVLRAQLTRQGYELDPSFQCAPDLPGISSLGPLIDIAAWPPGITPQATLMAMDARGNVLFCQPGKSPEEAAMPPPPAMELTNLMAFALDLDDLYVLDPANNAVWVYWKSNFTQQPQFFFGEEIPPMEDVIDLAVNNNDLYLLHQDGHVTFCVYSGLGVAPTRCTDPAVYVDTRPERENTPLITENPFRQVRFSPPPDPSLYLLEPVSQAIYHFSLRNLAFQNQYLPAQRLSANPATAFAVNKIERTFFLAMGNEVYYASMP